MKTKNLIVLIVLFLFVVGCGSNDGGQTKENFKQGYGSLEYNFMENAPPKKIYSGSNFKILLELHNKAAYDLNNGKVKIVGVDEKFFRINYPLERSYNRLEGRNLLNPLGEKFLVEFDAEAFELFENAERYQNDYFLKLSFDSKFEFVDTVCINSNLYNIYNVGCSHTPRKTYSGQGAPMAVTEVESIVYPSSAGTEIEFRVLIKNRGKGKANFVNLEKAELGGKEIKDCRFQSAVQDPKGRKVLFLKDRQEDLIICQLYIPEQSSYMTTLSLDFTYDYEIDQRQSLTMFK